MDPRHYVALDVQRLIYARVPKVANTSIKASLRRLLAAPKMEGERVSADAFWRESLAGEARMITAQEAWSVRDTYFCFSFVRNPFDRIVSAYNNKVLINSDVSTPMKHMGLFSEMPFQEFIECVARTDDEEIDVHLLPQSSILAPDGLIVPQFVGRYEDMRRDWRKLRRLLKHNGFADLGKLPKRNVRREEKTDVAAYFSSDRLIDIVAERYERDLSLFFPGKSPRELVQ